MTDHPARQLLPLSLRLARLPSNRLFDQIINNKMLPLQQASASVECSSMTKTIMQNYLLMTKIDLIFTVKIDYFYL